MLIGLITVKKAKKKCLLLGVDSGSHEEMEGKKCLSDILIFAIISSSFPNKTFLQVYLQLLCECVNVTMLQSTW